LSRFARVGVASAASASSLPSPSFDVDAARQQRALVRLVVGAKPRRERVRDLGIRRRASRRASRRARSRVSRRRGVAAAL